MALDTIRLSYLTSASTLVRRFGEDKIYNITIRLQGAQLVLFNDIRPDKDTISKVFDNQIHPSNISIDMGTIKFSSRDIVLTKVENNLSKIHDMARFVLDNLRFTEDIVIIITLLPEDQCK